jgi:hypothetical protein
MLKLIKSISAVPSGATKSSKTNPSSSAATLAKSSKKAATQAKSSKIKPSSKSSERDKAKSAVKENASKKLQMIAKFAAQRQVPSPQPLFYTLLLDQMETFTEARVQ